MNVFCIYYTCIILQLKRQNLAYGICITPWAPVTKCHALHTLGNLEQRKFILTVLEAKCLPWLYWGNAVSGALGENLGPSQRCCSLCPCLPWACRVVCSPCGFLWLLSELYHTDISHNLLVLSLIQCNLGIRQISKEPTSKPGHIPRY